MKKISLWARQHRMPAISIIIASKLALASIAVYVGSGLQSMDLHIPQQTFVFIGVMLIIAVLAYPSRWSPVFNRKRFYIHQKTCDFAIAASSFLMITVLANNNFSFSGENLAYASSISNPTAEEILASLKYRDKSSLTRQEKRILKEEFRKQIKVYAIAKIKGKKDEAGKALLIALTVIAAVGLLYLVAALACSLSCNGSDVAAVVVGIVGAALVVWGSIVLIRRISRGPHKKNEVEPTTAN